MVIDALSKEVKQLMDINQIYGVGATLNAFLKLQEAYESKTHQEVITFKQIKQILKMVDISEKSAYSTLIRTIPECIHTMIPGLAIIKAIFKFFNAETLHISKYDVGQGSMQQHLKYKKMRGLNSLGNKD